MFKASNESTMNGRGGFPIRNVLFGVFAIIFLYMLYINNGTSSQLKESEMKVERYVREAKDRVNEIQGKIV